MASRTASAAAALALAALVAIACTDAATDPNPGGTGGDGQVGTDSTADVTVLPAVSSDSVTIALADAQMAVCSPVPADSASAVIGPDGGRIEIGKNRLDIPKGALLNDTLITMVVLGDSSAAVRLEPHGLVFQHGPDTSAGNQPGTGHGHGNGGGHGSGHGHGPVALSAGGSGNGVRLRLDYDRCDGARESGKPKRVVYFDENGQPAEIPATADDHRSHGSEATIGHFSKYGIMF